MDLNLKAKAVEAITHTFRTGHEAVTELQEVLEKDVMSITDANTVVSSSVLVTAKHTDGTVRTTLIETDKDKHDNLTLSISKGSATFTDNETADEFFLTMKEHVGLWYYEHSDEDFKPDILQFGLGSINNNIFIEKQS